MELNNEHLCNACGGTFQNQGALLIHKKRKHETSQTKITIEMKDKHLCDVCGETLSNRGALLTHTKWKHDTSQTKITMEMNDKHLCETCGGKFQTRGAFVAHTKWKHETSQTKIAMEMNDKYLCETCGASFQYLAALLSHKKWSHDTENPVNRCSICSRTFHRKFNLNRHLKSCSPRRLKQDKTKHNCFICDFSGLTRAIIVQHYQIEHKINLVNKRLEFKTLQEFECWKDKFERDTKSKFVKHSGTQQSKGGLQMIKYRCHRDGNFRPRSKNVRRLKALGSNKINSHCPAKIYAYISAERVIVNYIDTHVGHDLELERLSLNKSEKDVIAQKLASKIPFQQILDDIRDSVTSDEIDRVHLLTRKDLWNIATSYNLNHEAVLDKNDYDSVDAWVCHMQSTSNLVRFYKTQGEVSKIYPQLKHEDFFLVVMNDAQLEILQRFGKDCICIDEIQDLNTFDFQLYTLMVLDDMRQGFPCAFVFSNRDDTLSKEIFFKTIKLCLNNESMIPKTFMSDMDKDNTFYNVWSAVMGPVENQLHCSWHVDQAWRNNLNKIKTEDKQALVYKKLKMLMFETDIKTFEVMNNDLFTELIRDSDTEEFVKYFEKYKNNCSTWAYSHRKQCDLNASMSFENMHKIIKHFYFDGKKFKRMDKGIPILMKYIRDKLFNKLVILNKGKIANTLMNLRAKHKKSLSLAESSIEETNDFWNVTDSNNKDIYKIERNNINCKCELHCTECKTCIHAYMCTCVDSSVKWNMCKHIHLICTFLKNKDLELGLAETDINEDSNSTHNELHMDASTETHLVVVSEKDDIVNEVSKKSDPTWDEKKNDLLQKFLNTFNRIENEEQLQAVTKEIAALDSIVETCHKKVILIPEVSNLEPPTKKIKLPTMIFYKKK